MTNTDLDIIDGLRELDRAADVFRRAHVEGDITEQVAAALALFRAVDEHAPAALAAEFNAAIRAALTPDMRADAVALVVVDRHAPVQAACPDPSVEGDCWLATKGLNDRGRAVLTPRLRSISPNTARFVWTLLHGRPLGDVLVLHRCGVARCVNPGHLYSGTRADNARDARRHAALRPAAQDGAPPGGC